MNVLNIAETTKGGISTYFDSISTSKYVNNDFLAFGYPSVINLPESNNRIYRLLFLIYKLLTSSDFKKYEIWFFHSSYAGLIRPVVFILAKINGIKVFYCSHGWSFDRDYRFLPKKRKWFERNIEKILSYFTDLIICISDHDRISFGKPPLISSVNVKTIPNGVRDIVTQDEDIIAVGVNILFVGRFDRQKGLLELLRALKRIDEKLSSRITLNLIGDYVVSNSTYLESYLDNDYKNIIINRLGWVDNLDLDTFYSSASFTVVPSLWEGFGLVVAESYRNDTPVLCSSSGSLKNMVPLECGWRFDHHITYDLDEKLLEIISDRKWEIINEGCCRRQFLDNYSSDVMNARYWEAMKGEL